MSRIVALLAMSVFLVSAADARAASVGSDGGPLAFTTRGQEESRLTITLDGDRYTISDRGAESVEPSTPTCRRSDGDPQVAFCDAAGVTEVSVILGDGDDEATLYFRSHLVLVSRLARIQPPVDGVWTSIEDTTGLRADTMRGRRLGFGGKLCIHPSQVTHVNTCFRPSDEQVAWARRVLDAVALSKGSAVKVDGGMVDVPVIRKAEAIVAELT